MTTIDVCSTSEIERLGPCWDDLAGRALEPNPFAERAFLIPALRHLSRRKLVVLCVWNGPDLARLDAIAVLRASVVPFGVVDVWRVEQAPYAALLLDRESAAPAVEAISCWLARQWPGAVGLGIADVDVNGALAETLRMLAARRRLRLDLSSPRRRAALACGAGANFERPIAARRRKEWARLKRRLMERGRLDFEWSDNPAAIELQTTPHASAAFELAIRARRAKALARQRVKGLVSRWRRGSASPRASAPPPAA